MKMYKHEVSIVAFVVTCSPAVRRMQSKGILVQVFPLHEREELKRLSFTWYQRVKLTPQPLGKQRARPGH